MKNITNKLKTPFLAAAALATVLSCQPPVQQGDSTPDLRGTIDVHLPQGPYSYNIIISVWDVDHVALQTTGGINAGSTDYSFKIGGGSYDIEGQGWETINPYPGLQTVRYHEGHTTGMSGSGITTLSNLVMN